MNIEPSYVIFGAGLLLGAISWLSKIHYDLIQLRRDARGVETKTVEIRHHYDEEIARLRSDLAIVRNESQSNVSALKEGMVKLELRIETGFTQVMEQMKQLFRDQDKH